MRWTQISYALIAAAEVIATNVHVDFTQACWTVVNESIAANPSLAHESQLQCGQSYSPSTPPALNVNISLPVCLERWPGWQISNVKVLNQWVGPLAGFLLPAVVFVLVIPRNYRLPRGDSFFNHHIIVSFLWLILAFFLLALDVLIWIMMVFGLAGPVMVGTLDEGLKDWRILRSIEKAGVQYSRAEASYALAVTLVGTFKPREDLGHRQANDLVDDVVDQICNASDVSKTKEKLRQLLGQQVSYGVQIGAPVVFYLGAYAYSIFDADSRLGDNDTAHAIAFGLWYGLIVLTATSCCCVPGLNNPSTIESIFDTPHVEKTKESLRSFFSPYESQHRSVWSFNRPRCARDWVNKNIVDAGNIGGDEKPIHPKVRSILNSKGLSVLSCLLAITAVSVICGLAFSISYFTPRIGFGCRATTILCHGTSQIVLIICWFYHNQDDDKKTHWIKWPVYVLAALLFAFSVFVAIGGTIMQLLGVYRNCICKAGLKFWLNQTAGIVVLSSDTQEDRDLARLWIRIGAIGISYVGVFCILGWGYFMRMKAKTKEQIEALR